MIPVVEDVVFTGNFDDSDLDYEEEDNDEYESDEESGYRGRR
jgi:hypothetical protein